MPEKEEKVDSKVVAHLPKEAYDRYVTGVEQFRANDRRIVDICLDLKLNIIMFTRLVQDEYGPGVLRERWRNLV